MGIIEVKQGDITEQKTEAIVNVANTDLLHGGGVAAAIIKAGGEKIQEESNNIAPIPLGQAAVTTGGKLNARYVIHAAAMRLGELAVAENVQSAIKNSFERALELQLKTIAFPAIGAGIAKLPAATSASVSLIEAKKYKDKFERIVFVLYNAETYKAFMDEYNKTKNKQ